MESKRVNLALQGGGAHGAFTWGVLDALLEEGSIDIDGLSGASAGAINAALMADGWLTGIDAGTDPRASARAKLREFWTTIGRQPSAFSLGAFGNWALPRDFVANPILVWADLMSRLFSPYQLNPSNYNPLRLILDRLIDIERLRQRAPFKLFICATNVRTGRVRIFREFELTIDMLLASACLPFTFQAVKVGDEHFWDGGYMGNPALFPLFYVTEARDLLLVQINPSRRDDVPETAQEIIGRVNEISFNSSLLQELRAIAFVQRLLDEKRLDPTQYKRVWFHVIEGGDTLAAYGASSKSDTSPRFLNELFTLGRKTATTWLEDKLVYVGHTSSTRIADQFL